jgi:hypothetical protein
MPQISFCVSSCIESTESALLKHQVFVDLTTNNTSNKKLNKKIINKKHIP